LEAKKSMPTKCVFGDGHGLVKVFVLQDAKHGAEDLLARDPHVRGDVGEDGRFHEVPAVQTVAQPGNPPAGGGTRPFGQLPYPNGRRREAPPPAVTRARKPLNLRRRSGVPRCG
jgi:hypothetical protein